LPSKHDALSSNHSPSLLPTKRKVGHWWLTYVVLATQEAEIRRIEVQNQHRQIVLETLSGKYLTQKRAGGVA
jgi:hypothetical protein